MTSVCPGCGNPVAVAHLRCICPECRGPKHPRSNRCSNCAGRGAKRGRSHRIPHHLEPLITTPDIWAAVCYAAAHETYIEVPRGARPPTIAPTCPTCGSRQYLERVDRSLQLVKSPITGVEIRRMPDMEPAA